MSVKLAQQIRLAVGEIETIRQELEPLIHKPDGYQAANIERAAACAMLHSFYTQIEKAFELIARDSDGSLPVSETWHRDLLKQMLVPAQRREAIIPEQLAADLGEFLAFRHLFRGASIVLMRWEKLVPLLAKVNETSRSVNDCLKAFAATLENDSR